jgi:hypothetical protein
MKYTRLSRVVVRLSNKESVSRAPEDEDPADHY